MKNVKITRKWKSISLILVGMGFFSTLTFNCAPSLFQSATYSSSGSFLPFSIFGKVNAPLSLLTGEQSFQTMLHVTDQEATSTNAQMSEYQDTRFTALSANDNLPSMTSSMILASTSLAGEVCNGLVAREKQMAVASRRFFANLDFTVTPAKNTLAGFLSSANMLAVSAWGRNMSQEEQVLFSNYFEEFKSNLQTTNNPAQTENLAITTCAAVLSSFDALVY